jgi:hypothetical protein
MQILFNVGQVVATKNVMEIIEQKEIFQLVNRHITGDFGDLDKSDTQMNKNAIKTGEDRIFSAYTIKGNKIYVITEWDRSYTTVMLASDY